MPRSHAGSDGFVERRPPDALRQGATSTSPYPRSITRPRHAGAHQVIDIAGIDDNTCCETGFSENRGRHTMTTSCAMPAQPRLQPSVARLPMTRQRAMTSAWPHRCFSSTLRFGAHAPARPGGVARCFPTPGCGVASADRSAVRWQLMVMRKPTRRFGRWRTASAAGRALSLLHAEGDERKMRADAGTHRRAINWNAISPSPAILAAQPTGAARPAVAAVTRSGLGGGLVELCD